MHVSKLETETDRIYSGKVALRGRSLKSDRICSGIQIPFDMRSVIPAICGHSFFKYFYGCKVNVLIRHLVNRPIFLLILLPQAVAGELEAQGFVDNSVQTCLCDELALEQAIVVSHRQLAAKY